MKRVTFRITVTMTDKNDKQSAKKWMERAISLIPVLADPFVQVLQIDDLPQEVTSND